MKIHAALPVLLAALTIGTSSLSVAATSDCADTYFSAEDFNHEHPLSSPVPAFADSYKQAMAGNAVEQRNVAVSYDAGYLVAACPEKARYWYRKAASKGDEIAQSWVERDDRFQEMLAGPEFAVVESAGPSRMPVNARTTAPVLASAEGAQSTGPRSAESMLADVTRPPQQSSSMGKVIEIGRLVGDLIGSK